jgi:hypothetical protein
MAVIHLFDQPLTVARPYEAYMGSLTIPGEVARTAEQHSIHVDLLTPRRKLVEAIEITYPGIRRQDIHVWTLGGKSRQARLGRLWEEWRSLGAHLVEDGWTTPGGGRAFTESGTYAPTYLVGSWRGPQGEPHVFLCDGYAASAEALQAASLSEALDVDVTMAHYSPRFELPMEDEYRLMRLDQASPSFAADLQRIFGDAPATAGAVAYYRGAIREMLDANMPRARRVVRADDFFPEKDWRVLAANGYIGDDPYTGAPGVTRLNDDTWQVTTLLATRRASLRATFTFRFLESLEQTRLVFSPLLERFMSGEDYRSRAVKISDSGRIRNELQTLCSQALEYTDSRIVIHFDRIDDEVMAPEKQQGIRRILEWYKAHHPVWFRWLEIG